MFLGRWVGAFFDIRRVIYFPLCVTFFVIIMFIFVFSLSFPAVLFSFFTQLGYRACCCGDGRVGWSFRGGFGRLVGRFRVIVATREW